MARPTDQKITIGVDDRAGRFLAEVPTVASCHMSTLNDEGLVRVFTQVFDEVRHWTFTTKGFLRFADVIAEQAHALRDSRED